MPLILLSGLPCSGKSERAKKLYEYFNSSKKTILIQDDNTPTGFDRNIVFSVSQKEKELRSSLKSEVERHLSKDTVVILDSGNYIKGYRYELYCLSKGCKTTHCVIHCDLLPEDCWAFNEQRPQSLQYKKEIFEALIQRFESPDSRNRWDSPLFISHKDEALPLSDIDDALFMRKAPPPNLSTQNQPLSSTNYLYDLDKMTQDIVKAVLDAQKTSAPGDQITVPKAQQKVLIFDSVSAASLARVRRQFISYAKAHPASDSSKVPEMFVQFLNKNL